MENSYTDSTYTKNNLSPGHDEWNFSVTYLQKSKTVRRPKNI